ncbi:MAG: Maf family protein [Bacteroidia bacterium]|nr:Maf family protein [Bacteroidia bacterium]MDW8333602.1 Maf family protein [Bacteroidia bacterium]
MKFPPIFLASRSPRRIELLKNAGLDFIAEAADVDENAVPAWYPKREIPAYLSRKKAEFFRHRSDEYVVVGADTLVLCDGAPMGKPADARDAQRMLKELSGKTHEVVGGVSLIYRNKTHTFSETTAVRFRALSDDEIAYYVERFRPLDKAGAYGIQEWIGLRGVMRIEGDYYNVMGLPVCRLVREMESFLATCAAPCE